MVAVALILLWAQDRGYRCLVRKLSDQLDDAQLKLAARRTQLNASLRHADMSRDKARDTQERWILAREELVSAVAFQLWARKDRMTAMDWELPGEQEQWRREARRQVEERYGAWIG